MTGSSVTTQSVPCSSSGSLHEHVNPKDKAKQLVNEIPKGGWTCRLLAFSIPVRQLFACVSFNYFGPGEAASFSSVPCTYSLTNPEVAGARLCSDTRMIPIPNLAQKFSACACTCGIDFNMPCSEAGAGGDLGWAQDRRGHITHEAGGLACDPFRSETITNCNYLIHVQYRLPLFCHKTAIFPSQDPTL